jgi:ABC-type transporter Mla subunit MlaD
MRARIALLALGTVALAFTCATRFSAQDKKDYLSDSEADKIREAYTTSNRMLLFVSFADDRIAKLKYTLAHPIGDHRRADQLNALINGYSGCIDDAADLIDVAREKQQDIRAGLKSLIASGKENLIYLLELQKTGPELESYKVTLDDAVEATQDAISDAEKAQKDIAPPVRRKQ